MKYERLTKYSEINKDYITPYCDNFICDGVCRDCDYEQIIINRLAELEDKIEDGTLVELPCKVGDTLYRFYATECVIPVKVERITIASIAILVETTYGNFLLQEVGRDIFLTKAEAEKQLKELRGER